MKAKLLVPAHPLREIRARALKLTEPISFWGGVDPGNGRLSDPRSKLHDVSIAGAALCITELRGSSSASSVLLELIYKDWAPAMIILREPDAILALGILVAREMGWSAPALLQLPSAAQDAIPNGAELHVSTAGRLTVEEFDA